jgi:hypothetical protein
MAISTLDEQGRPAGQPPSRGGFGRNRGAGGLFLAAILGLALGFFLGNAIGMQLTGGPIAMIPLGGDFSFAVAVSGAAAGALIGGMGGAPLWSCCRHAKQHRRVASGGA